MSILLSGEIKTGLQQNLVEPTEIARTKIKMFPTTSSTKKDLTPFVSSDISDLEVKRRTFKSNSFLHHASLLFSMVVFVQWGKHALYSLPLKSG